MTKNFCGQCGSGVPDGAPFCPACGTAQRTAAQPPYPGTSQPNPNQPVYQQSYQPPYQPSPQVYRPQAGPQPAYFAPRVSGARATGLIVGLFALIAAFLLVVLILVLPSKEDFSILGTGEAPQAAASSTVQPGDDAALPATAEKYGEPPSSVLIKINVNAKPEDYAGSYNGTASFRNENLHIMSEATGDSSYEDILKSYNGKTYDCTAETDDSIRAFSPEIYSDFDDGNFYTYYYFDIDLENGVALYEESDYDEDMGCRYYIADKAYFLTDGSIYVINITTAEFDDGRFLASEIRLELKPER